VSQRNRLIVVITEGAAPALLDRWIAEGHLPALAELHRRGSSGPLDAEGTPYEASGLVSLLTGRPAGDHGIYSYWSCHEPNYQPRVLTSEDVPYPLLWHRPEAGDRSFTSIGLFGTHPPKPLNGNLITYPMYATLHACHPPQLQRTLAGRGIRPVHDVSIFWTGQPRDELLPRLLEADRQRGKAAMALFDDGADFVVVNLTSIDRTSHIYWQELERECGVDTDTAVFAAYRTADAVVAEALRRVDDRTDVVAFSEIGFGPLREYCSINQELERLGFLKQADDGSVSFVGTTAFEAVQGTHGVNINMADRYADGQVATADYERVRADVADALRAVLNPRTGLPLLSDVRTREEVYPGERTALAPDLVLEPADWRYLPLGDPQWASHVHRSWQSGWHRRHSYWAGAGPHFGAGHRRTDAASVPDVTATMLDVLGHEPASWCAGESLTAGPA
jgi:predicted AlkP superfamily phosphohydrolase/phosphomutase